MHLIWIVVIGLSTVAVLSVIIGVPLGLLLPRTKEFGANFMYKCEKFMGKEHKDYCQRLLNLFEQAYVGKDKCKVPMEAYDPLINEYNLDHPCNQMTLWSYTKDFIHTYITNNPDCFSLEKTLLGFVLDGENWCGKVNSKETYTRQCPEYDVNCENNPYYSFWRRVSIHFASYACGQVTAMLNGGQEEPFNHSSLFALEIENLRSPSVTRLNVVLINGDESKCNSPNLQVLWTKLRNKGIGHDCKTISGPDIKKCIACPSRPCGASLF